MEIIGLMHDIGKIAIKKSVLNKLGWLTDEEKKEIARHPEIGYRILNTSTETTHIAKHVLAHHEHYDGTGYPFQIRGEEIPLQSRIIAVADAFDAMTSNRAYRSAQSTAFAVKELKTNAGTQFDPKVVEVFLNKVLGEVS